MALVYKPNEKHKRGAAGVGPPRWFPSNASLCPDDFPLAVATQLLECSIEGESPEHPNARARYVFHEGSFYKGYPEGQSGDDEAWHGYPVHREQVPRQVPARVLKQLRDRGDITNGEYRSLLGSAR